MLPPELTAVLPIANENFGAVIQHSELHIQCKLVSEVRGTPRDRGPALDQYRQRHQ
jgi:hypothetical protein